MRRVRSQRDGDRSPAGFDLPLHDALTDLHAYVLLLDGEWLRMGRHMAALSRAGDDAEAGPELAELERRRDDLGEELEALRVAAGALREDAEADRRSAAEADIATRARAGRRAPPPGSGSRPAA